MGWPNDAPRSAQDGHIFAGPVFVEISRVRGASNSGLSVFKPNLLGRIGWSAFGVLSRVRGARKIGQKIRLGGYGPNLGHVDLGQVGLGQR